MSKGCFSYIHIVVVAFICILNGCAGTSSQEAVPSVNTPKSLAVTEPDTLTRFGFNQGLENDLNDKNLSRLQSKIDVLLIAQQLRTIQPQQFLNPLITAKTAADIKQQLVSGMLELSNVFTWHYLHSELIGSDKIAAYYRIDNDEGYSYITFWLSADSYKIYDFHPVSFHFSTLNFVGEFTQLFTKYSERQAQLAELILASQKNEWDTVTALYQELDADIKAEPVLNDFLLRKYSQMQNDSPEFMAALIRSYEQQNLSSLLFESYYIQQDNFTQAIKMVEGLPEFARQDSKMLSEMAILYAYNQDFEPAVLHGRRAIFAAPNDNEAYFVLLQVSLLAKDYDLSIELIEVLISKFDFIMGQDVIAEFDDSANFIRSDQYQQWLKTRSLS
jgi:tetratricopeptide (TPR) repeat protein